MRILDDFPDRFVIGKHGESHFDTPLFETLFKSLFKPLFKSFLFGTDFQQSQVIQFLFCPYHIVSLFPDEFF